MQDILVAIAVGIIIGLAIYRFIKSRRTTKGKKGCGCNGCK